MSLPDRFRVRIARQDELVILNAWLGPRDWTVQDYVGLLVLEDSSRRCVGAAELRFATGPVGDHFRLMFQFSEQEAAGHAFPPLLDYALEQCSRTRVPQLLVLGVPQSVFCENVLRVSGFTKVSTAIFYRGDVALGQRAVGRSGRRLYGSSRGFRVVPVSLCSPSDVLSLVAAETQGVGVGARALITGDAGILSQFSASFGVLFEETLVAACIARHSGNCAFIEALAVNQVGRRLHVTPTLISRVLGALAQMKVDKYEFVASSANRPMTALARHLACEETTRRAAWLLSPGRQL